MNRNQKLAVGAGAAIALAVPVVMHFEGKRNDPYNDVIGVRTVCYGETRGVEERRYTDAECTAMLMKALAEFDREIGRCITRPVPDNVRAAVVSIAYNAGSKAICDSTLMRKLNAGDIAGACAEFDRWVLAGGKKLQGLVNRRKAERELCEGKHPKLK